MEVGAKDQGRQLRSEAGRQFGESAGKGGEGGSNLRANYVSLVVCC